MGEDSGQVENTESLPDAEAIAPGRFAQIGRDGHRSGYDIEEDIPLGPHEHQHHAAPAQGYVGKSESRDDQWIEHGSREGSDDLDHRLQQAR